MAYQVMIVDDQTVPRQLFERIIGASELSLLAARLESAADGGREAEIDGSHAELLGRYGAVTDAIRAVTDAPELTMADDDVMEFLPEEE